MPAPAVVELEQVAKTYAVGPFRRRRIVGLLPTDLRVEPGVVLGLLGPNRAGKSTLLKLLLSICRPTAGRMHRLGAPVADKRTLRRVGYMHENQAFPRYLTPQQLLHYYGALSGLTAKTLAQRAPRLLEMVGLADRAQDRIAHFSKGMVQRLALAQALLNQPELLVLDEPTEGLDQPGRQLIHQVVRDQQAAGKTTILVSHVLADVERLCDCAVVLVQGRIVYQGRREDLQRDPAAETLLPLETVLPRFYGVAAS